MGCNIAIADIDWEAAKATAQQLMEMKHIAYAYHVSVKILVCLNIPIVIIAIG